MAAYVDSDWFGAMRIELQRRSSTCVVNLVVYLLVQLAAGSLCRLRFSSTQCCFTVSSDVVITIVRTVIGVSMTNTSRISSPSRYEGTITADELFYRIGSWGHCAARAADLF